MSKLTLIYVFFHLISFFKGTIRFSLLKGKLTDHNEETGTQPSVWVCKLEEAAWVLIRSFWYQSHTQPGPVSKRPLTSSLKEKVTHQILDYIYLQFYHQDTSELNASGCSISQIMIKHEFASLMVDFGLVSLPVNIWPLGLGNSKIAHQSLPISTHHFLWFPSSKGQFKSIQDVL